MVRRYPNAWASHRLSLTENKRRTYLVQLAQPPLKEPYEKRDLAPTPHFHPCQPRPPLARSFADPARRGPGWRRLDRNAVQATGSQGCRSASEQEEGSGQDARA